MAHSFELSLVILWHLILFQNGRGLHFSCPFLTGDSELPRTTHSHQITEPSFLVLNFLGKFPSQFSRALILSAMLTFVGMMKNVVIRYTLDTFGEYYDEKCRRQELSVHLFVYKIN